MSHRKPYRAPATALALLTAAAAPAALHAADPPVVWMPPSTAVFNDPLPGYWSTKVELADIDDDGWVDILFANVGGYQAGTPDSFQSNQAWHNDGGVKFSNISLEVFGEDPGEPGVVIEDTARVIKAHDLDKDGDTDIIVGATWASKSRLYLQEGGAFKEQSNLLPNQNLSAGDLELGDVDGDGDLDVVISDWGPAPVGFPQSTGGITRLWLNNGNAMFTDATAAKMPPVNVNWSWDHEFIDIDNDWDLDLLISCRSCAGGSLAFENDGKGKFTNATNKFILANAIGATDFEVMDLDGDGWVDAVSLQDGQGFTNRVHINTEGALDGAQTAFWWPAPENPASFDYGAAFCDYDSDGRPDLVLGAFAKNPDRLMANQGNSFKRVTDPSAFGAVPTDGTYSIAVSDLNGDRKIDVAFAEGENFFRNRVFFGEDIAEDTQPPAVLPDWYFVAQIEPGGEIVFRARIHDYKSPNKPHDWQEISLQWVVDGGSFDNPGDIQKYDLEWYGEYLWRTRVEPGEGLILPDFNTKIAMRACAIDIAGNETCVEVQKEYFLCGDGKVNSPKEACDDGNQQGGDGCENDCQLTPPPPPVCGNGIVEGDEECDDNNTLPGDGCSPLCAIEMDETTSTTSASESDSETQGTATMTASTTDPTASATDGTATDASDTDSATTGLPGLDDDGCGCRTDTSRGLGTSLLLLGLLAVRRRRRS